jgi:type II secretory pathway pseudopilin PulG
MRSAFTLVEILLILGIIVLLGGVGLSAIYRLRLSVEVNNGIELFKQMLQKAQINAQNNVGMNNNKVSAWVISTDTSSIRLLSCNFTNIQAMCNESQIIPIPSQIELIFRTNECSAVGYTSQAKRLIGVSKLPLGNIIYNGQCIIDIKEFNRNILLGNINIDITNSSIKYEKY